MTTRRNFIRSAAGILIAAPMVVRAGSIMPVRVIPKRIAAPAQLILSLHGAPDGGYAWRGSQNFWHGSAEEMANFAEILRVFND